MAKMCIGGEWVGSTTAKERAIINPANGEVVDTVPEASAEDMRAAIDAAQAALPAWSATPAERRAHLLLKGVELLEQHKQEIACVLTREQGKPLAESLREFEHFLHGLTFYAGLASKIRGAQVALPQDGMFGMVVKQPVGVCGAIVPWNFPLTLMGTKVGPALAAGNTIIVKPAATTPLATIQCIGLLNQAGIPNGVLSVVTGQGSTVGEELLENPKVRRIAFTGSTPVGKHVMEVAGRTLKRVTLELGGSDPMIVCDDADIKKALTGASVGRFYNCGQACLAIKRLYLFDSIADAFIQQLVEKVQRLTVGDPMDEQTRVGPMHTKEQRQEIEEQLESAVKQGAKVLIGGKRPEGEKFAKGNYFLPTLVTEVDPSTRLVREEVFGPALPIFRVKDLDEAIEQANASIFGLGASIWTRDLAKSTRAVKDLQAGNVWVNSLHIGYDELPFGGVKQSGIGREHGPEALEHYLELKGVVMAT
ncbi:MAG: aldehyde dehydrogenase [Acidobacteria bacterium]|nr:aldehyde dehydrogenase [Acidobacteriota bacterium]